MKLEQALNYYLAVDRAEQTRSTYERFLRRFVAAIGPERPLRLITPEDLDAYVSDMHTSEVRYASHPRRRPEKRALSEATVCKNVKMIKAFFKWCVTREYIRLSPARFLSANKPLRPIGLGKAATDDEVALLLAGVQFEPRNRALLILLLQSGCRAGEAAALKISNLDLDKYEARVDGKGSKFRTIYFGPETVMALRVWFQARPAVEHDYVFTATRGNYNPLSSGSVSLIIRRLAEKVGLHRPLGPHSFRHRVGNTFSRAGIPVRVTQNYLGHSSPDITYSYYQDVDEKDLHQAGRLLSTPMLPGSEDELREIKKSEEIVKRFRRTS